MEVEAVGIMTIVVAEVIVAVADAIDGIKNGKGSGKK